MTDNGKCEKGNGRGEGEEYPPLTVAYALSYDRERDQSPRLSAGGKGHIAARIIALARENDIPIREDPALVQALSTLKVDDSIPPELYRAVAEVYAWLGKIERKTALTEKRTL